MNSNIWLIGAGVMAQDYFKVLKSLGHTPTVLGRSEKSVREFESMTGCRAYSGGLASYLSSDPEVPAAAVVSVSRETLSEVTCQLLAYGVKKILVEKPAGLSNIEINNIVRLTKEAAVLVGFNRRFYSSVLKARELIQEDGGVQSFCFEFTEWSHKLRDLVSIKGEKVMQTWFLGNSIHVADLAFFLGGGPQEISTYSAGGLDWHPSSSIFAGAGVSKSGALFSYHANWESAGRWGVEILTAQRKLILRPLEELHVQKKGSIVLEKMEIDSGLDQQFKPGLYLQVKNFLEGSWNDFVDVADLQKQFPTYLKMAGYKSL
jgi:predicted dehydrogenase